MPRPMPRPIARALPTRMPTACAMPPLTALRHPCPGHMPAPAPLPSPALPSAPGAARREGPTQGLTAPGPWRRGGLSPVKPRCQRSLGQPGLECALLVLAPTHRSGQLNGNQKGTPPRGRPNLSCPRNGKRTRLQGLQSLHMNPLVPRHWEGCSDAIRQPGYRPTGEVPAQAAPRFHRSLRGSWHLDRLVVPFFSCPLPSCVLHASLRLRACLPPSVPPPP